MLEIGAAPFFCNMKGRSTDDDDDYGGGASAHGARPDQTRCRIEVRGEDCRSSDSLQAAQAGEVEMEMEMRMRMRMICWGFYGNTSEGNGEGRGGVQ